MVTWKALWTESREKIEITPKIKEDYYKIMSEAIRTSLNADAKVKAALLKYLMPYSFEEYKSFQTYKWAAILPPTFIQWLSEARKKEITLIDLDPPNISADDAAMFAREYSTSEFVRAQVRSYLVGFGKYLDYRGLTSKNPFGGLKVRMPRSRRVILYNNDELNEFFNIVLFGAEPYTSLFFRMVLQTGLRPLHAFYLTYGDIQAKPQKDALDRTFYPIESRQILEREKRKIGESVGKKFPPDFSYISEKLRNDMIKWCELNKLSSSGYLFKDFITMDAYDMYLRRRRESPKIAALLKTKQKYILYGLRHTWASIIYAVTGADVGAVMDLGGWADDTTVLKVYRNSMDEQEAFKIAKNWEIYLPPKLKSQIQRIQSGVEEKEKPIGEPAISKGDLDKMWDFIEKQKSEMKSMADKIKELENIGGKKP